MIVKKEPTSKVGALKNKALNVRALLDYIAGPNETGRTSPSGHSAPIQEVVGRGKSAMPVVSRLLLPIDMDRAVRRARMGFIMLAFAAGASCATASRETAGVATPPPRDPRSCVLQVFPGVPPFEVEDLGPIQASCPTSTRYPSACGIDQPNLAEVACSSGADTVFGLYEVVRPSQDLFSSNERVMHARLGQRRIDVKGAANDGSAR